MNNVAMARAVQNAVRLKFYGNRTLRSKTVTHFPAGVSDEYERLAGAYMRMLNQALRSHLPAIRRAMDSERKSERADKAMRRDSSVLRIIRQAIERARIDFERRARHFGLGRRIERLAESARRHSVREWRRVVRRTLGVNIFEDYYAGEFYRHAIKRWVANNVSLIKSLPGQSLTRMQNIIENGYFEGKSNDEIGRLSAYP